MKTLYIEQSVCMHLIIKVCMTWYTQFWTYRNGDVIGYPRFLYLHNSKQTYLWTTIYPIAAITQQSHLIWKIPKRKRNWKECLMLTITSCLFNFKTDVLRKYFKYEEGNKVRFKPRGATEYKEIELDYDTMEYIEDIFYSLMAEYEINLDKLTY